MQTLDEWEFLIAPLLFTLVSFFTRMYKIGLSNIVTWDEAQYVIFGIIRNRQNIYFCLQADQSPTNQLWKVRLPLLETRILLRCSSSIGKDAGRLIGIHGWIQWFIRIQVRRDLS